MEAQAKAAGYAGYVVNTLPGFLLSAQKQGNLRQYENHLIGCVASRQWACDKWNPKFKILQVLEGALLYSFSEFAGNQYIDLTLLMATGPREGELYVDGMSLPGNEVFEFTGTVTYQTTIGASKTVPSFRKAGGF